MLKPTIDIGCNFVSSKYRKKEINHIITQANQLQVTNMISISAKIDDIDKNIDLCTLHSSLYCTIGIHPHYAFKEINHYTQFKEKIDLYKNHPKVVAFGEMGLDYCYFGFGTKPEQRRVFRKQLQLAKCYNKPVYLHCRDAFNDFKEILTEFLPIKGVVHCFTGTKEEAEWIINNGLYIGITGWIFDERRNQELIKALEIIPIELIMVETDAPYLSINRKRDSLPQDIIEIIHEIQRLKQIPKDIDVENIIYKTTCDFFQLS